MPIFAKPRWIGLAAAAALILASSAWAAPSPPAMGGERAAAPRAPGGPQAVLGIAGARFMADETESFLAALAGVPGYAPWLALSGGGENGAFGAGLLHGWSLRGDRPTFGVVTGVSTGALMAPLVFAGPKYDGLLKAAYTSVTAADIFEFGGTQESLLDAWPLSKTIERQVTPELLRDVAAEHAKGRRLLVLTTSLDAQRPVAWNMGAIATAGDERALKLFRDVLLASASIPGLFQPVAIENELHADGGVVAPFYAFPEPLLRAALGGERLPAAKLYVVVNNSVAPEAQAVERATLPLLGRALSTAVKAGTRASLQLHGLAAQRSGLALEVAQIDGRFALTTDAPFDQRYMQELFAHAERLGREGAAFLGSQTGVAVASRR